MSSKGGQFLHQAGSSAVADETAIMKVLTFRTIVAPPGKLRVVIDTSSKGLIVYQINPQSPMEGLLFPGEIIDSIDGVVTRYKSAAAVNALMMQSAHRQRTLTVLSEL
jgi:hypothetical protein